MKSSPPKIKSERVRSALSLISVLKLLQILEAYDNDRHKQISIKKLEEYLTRHGKTEPTVQPKDP